MTDYLVCRCEDVSVAEVRAAIDAGASNAQEVKMRTRAGMGPCQGRVCRHLVEAMIGPSGEDTRQTYSAMTVHLPVRPTALRDLFTSEDGA
jgi:bacterioferritin-associated ferredoxin